MVSHLKATLLDVVKLQAKRLYTTYDSPLVTNQTDPDTPDVAEGEKKIYSFWINSFYKSSRNKVVLITLICNKHIEKTW